MVAVKNLVEAVHVFAGQRLATRSYILPITAKEVTGNGNQAFLVLVHDIERNRRNFGPAVTFFVAVADDAQEVVIAFLVFHKESQALKRRRILLACTRGIDINMTTVNSLYRRKALLLARLVHILTAGLDFQDAEHGSVVRKSNSRSIFCGSGFQNAIETRR